MCVVAPGKQPVTESERALSTSSGHIIHLMPGDNHYDPSSFCVVLAWNGLNHYTPTYLMKHSSILQHRCSVINRLLSTATNLFSDIESDLDESKDEDLIEQFHNLRDQTIQASHLLTLKGLEHPKLPKSVCGPDPNDVKSHLTRKTPLPLHPEPLISHALQHPLDPDSAVLRAHPTPYMQPPPSSKDIKQEDFDINPEDYKTDQTRCIKVPGQLAPGKLLHSQKELLVSIPYPLDPVKGHPPAKKDSVGARHFRKNLVPPPSESELVETIQNMPVRRITQQKSDEPAEVSHEDKGSRITQEKRQDEDPQLVIDVDQPDVIDVDKQQSSSSHPQHTSEGPPSGSDRIMQKTVIIDDDDEEEEEQHGVPPSSKCLVTSETVEEITIEIQDDPEEEGIMQKEKFKSLKRKMLPSRKSPRVKIPKLDLSKGVKTALPQKQQSLVEALAKNIVKDLKVPAAASKGNQDQPSSSSSSSSSKLAGKQRSVLEMYAQAAHRIAHPAQASDSQRKQPAPPAPRPPAPRPPPASGHPAAPAPAHHQGSQGLQLKQPWITHDPPRRRITQTQGSQEQQSSGVLKCTYCTYSTVRKESMTDHLRMHTGEKFKCDECPKDYYSKKGLRLHIRTAHRKIDRCLCTEAGCNWSGKDYGVRTVHLYEAHGIGPAPICDHPDCKDRGHFTNFRTLERHRETFHRQADLNCLYCDKKYKDQSNLQHHIEVAHKGKPFYQCDICGNFYTSRKSLQGHQRTDHK